MYISEMQCPFEYSVRPPHSSTMCYKSGSDLPVPSQQQRSLSQIDRAPSRHSQSNGQLKLYQWPSGRVACLAAPQAMVHFSCLWGCQASTTAACLRPFFSSTMTQVEGNQTSSVFDRAVESRTDGRALEVLRASRIGVYSAEWARHVGPTEHRVDACLLCDVQGRRDDPLRLHLHETLKQVNAAMSRTSFTESLALPRPLIISLSVTCSIFPHACTHLLRSINLINPLTAVPTSELSK